MNDNATFYYYLKEKPDAPFKAVAYTEEASKVVVPFRIANIDSEEVVDQEFLEKIVGTNLKVIEKPPRKGRLFESISAPRSLR